MLHAQRFVQRCLATISRNFEIRESSDCNVFDHEVEWQKCSFTSIARIRDTGNSRNFDNKANGTRRARRLWNSKSEALRSRRASCGGANSLEQRALINVLVPIRGDAAPKTAPKC